MKRFTLSLLAILCANAWAETATPAANQNLPSLKVTASKINRPYQTPSAVSHIEKDETGRDLNEIIRSSPSLFTQHDIGQGGISVNMRGLEGFGRVNTTIDGVSQTFYQTNPAHGWNGNTVYVNEDFLAGAEIERGLAHGAAGGNALGGSLNFRTLAPSDLVEQGKSFGGRLTLRRGSNGYGTNGMVALAHKQELANSGSFGALLAFGGKVKGGYKNGAGETIAGAGLEDNKAMESGVHARNFMGKLEYSPNRYHNLKFSYIGNRSRTHNNHTPIEVATDSGLLQYRYKPLSDLVDLRADVSYGESRQYFQKENWDNGYQNRTTKNPTWSFNLSNRSAFELGDSDLSLTYGTKIQRTRYHSDEDKLDNPEASSVLATGKQNTANIFAEAEWKLNKWTVTSGARYERYGYAGYLPPTEDDGAVVLPKGGNVHFNSKENHFNPYFGLAYQFTDWLQGYATYAHTSRAPNVQEFMYVNNLKNNPYSVNPYLRGETARNRDIGFNIFKQGFLKDNDTARLKVNYFNNRVKNYIFQDQFYVCNNFAKCSLDDYVHNGGDISPVGIFRNATDTTKIHGWEIEGGYDFGRGYINVAYSRSKTDTPTDWLADITSTTRTQPESQLVLDVGSRWLDNKLVVGARMTRMGDDTVPAGIDTDLNLPTTTKIKGGKKVFDLYAKYDINKHAKLFFNIDNLTNTVYNYPLSSGGTLGTGNTGATSDWANKGTGRGRTYYAGFTMQF
ncbi:TonB-dependent receptor [Kingella kingae]|uniref:TonB-dependent receptor domain-containing protein n=1 Tax=Kingella kingae TaxID=504 RepID=UPI00254A13A3|nr:TonB-dependent receptor [Kingella kingae]MDK4536315.1 TonB-dependent receptor [Kingella kingae]MDK4547413.1 TonB-dependent receptor [Kingella kingae]MDK4577027.1 TonB-dependent receptor [Kingella kingae]MDK4583059.1 TonB-dependent receptor [Kingella kingae]MDK4593223.1 TonB-dependent receptor [Kingella kingae]